MALNAITYTYDLYLNIVMLMLGVRRFLFYKIHDFDVNINEAKMYRHTT